MSSKTIVAFGASNSKQSINKQLANFAAHQLSNVEVILLDLNDFEMPIYSIDRQKENGIPPEAHRFNKMIAEADGIVISFAEHNGIFTAAFKNIYDWVSRIEKDVWKKKPMLLLSTSNGERGANDVLHFATNKYKRSNPNMAESFSLPNFEQNFSITEGITNHSLNERFKVSINELRKLLDD